jgi:cysteine desulfurase / selenocysteine lyase
MIEPDKIRTQFPIFSHHPELIYLDNAATTQKPDPVIRATTGFYQKENASIHRGIYELAANASQKYEQVRRTVARFIGAERPESIVYTSGATAGINLVAQSFLVGRLQPGDEVVISAMEHHANLIPWQQVCKMRGAKLVVIPVSETGEIDLAFFKKMLSERTKMVAVVHVSNTLGTVNPVEEIIEISHSRNIPVLIDGAQSVAHYPVDVQALGVDFFVFSGHKMFGPTGTGILYGKPKHLEAMQPIQFGGDMVNSVSFETTTFAAVPQRFEAGTTNIAGVIGLGAAIEFVMKFDKNEILAHLKNLTETATEALQQIEGLKIIGAAKNKSAIVSFTLGNVHPHDVATFLGAENIAVRAGNHCTQPLMDFYGLPGTTRASFTIYNTQEEVVKLAETLKDIQRFFA